MEQCRGRGRLRSVAQGLGRRQGCAGRESLRSRLVDATRPVGAVAREAVAQAGRAPLGEIAGSNPARPRVAQSLRGQLRSSEGCLQRARKPAQSPAIDLVAFGAGPAWGKGTSCAGCSRGNAELQSCGHGNCPARAVAKGCTSVVEGRSRFAQVRFLAAPRSTWRASNEDFCTFSRLANQRTPRYL